MSPLHPSWGLLPRVRGLEMLARAGVRSSHGMPQPYPSWEEAAGLGLTGTFPVFSARPAEQASRTELRAVPVSQPSRARGADRRAAVPTSHGHQHCPRGPRVAAHPASQVKEGKLRFSMAGRGHSTHEAQHTASVAMVGLQVTLLCPVSD